MKKKEFIFIYFDLSGTTSSPFLPTKHSPMAATPTMDYLTLSLCTQTPIHKARREKKCIKNVNPHSSTLW